MKSLEHRIKEYYQDKRLSDAQLKRITERVEPNTTRKPALLKYAMAAMIVMGLLGYIFVGHPYIKQYKIVSAYAQEIAYNHLKQLPMEVVSDDATVLTTSLPKLNFNVSYDKRLAAFGKLVGARYCHVDDQIAAQLRIKDAANNSLTCYQFKQQHEITFDKIISVKGVAVHLWNQDSIVFAVAQTKQEDIE